MRNQPAVLELGKFYPCFEWVLKAGLDGESSSKDELHIVRLSQCTSSFHPFLFQVEKTDTLFGKGEILPFLGIPPSLKLAFK